MSDETILITGGTGIVGAKYVEFFLNKGWRVLFTNRSSLKKKKLEDKFVKYRKKLKGYKIDLLKRNSLKSLLTKIKKDEFYINHLVNSARCIDFLKVDKTGMTSRENFLNEYLLSVYIPYELAFEIFNSHKKTLKTITNIALKAHKIIGCRGVTRSDFKFYKGKFYLLELNTQPGMTKLSLVPEIAKYKGISFIKLIEWILKDASINR